MADKAWKHEERNVARMLGGHRYPANSGGRVDVESDQYVAQVKLVKTLSLAQLEELCLEMEQIGSEKGKVGFVVVKPKKGRCRKSSRLFVLSEDAWRKLEERRGREQVTRRNTQE